MFFQQTARYTLALCLLQAVLLRATADLRVWQILQLSTLVIDAAMLYSLYWGLSSQGRLAMDKWRSEDWGCLLITLIATLYRTLFLLGVGFSRAEATRPKAA